MKITLDFRNCKTPEDVEKVFVKHGVEFAEARRQIKNIKEKGK